MRVALIIVAVLGAAFITSDRAMGAGPEAGNPQAAATGGKAAPAGASSQPANPLKARYDRVMEELKLPADKAPAVQKILDDGYNSLMEWIAKVDPEVVKLRQQMQAVHMARDPKTIEQTQAAMKRYRQIQAEMEERVLSVLEPLGKVLTAEQVETAKAILLPPKPRPQPQSPMGENPFHQLANVGLSKEQVGKIAKIMDEARAAKDKDKSGKGVDYDRQAWQQIVKEVLTNEQQTKLESLRTEAAHRRMALAILGGLELTEEQKAKVDAIWKKAYEDGAKKTQEERIDIYSKAQDKIIDEVLTDAQRKELQAGRGGAPHPVPPGMMGR